MTLDERLNRVREASGLHQVVLSGGSFQNVRLHLGLQRRLAAEGYTVLAPIELSPNDGAVSYGQAVVAAASLQTDSTFTASRRNLYVFVNSRPHRRSARRPWALHGNGGLRRRAPRSLPGLRGR